MAFTFDVNETPATNALAMYEFKTLLKGAGWIVPLSSDGITYNGSGDQITGGNTGAGGMNNNNAWFVLKQPAAVDSYQRQILFFRAANTANWWVQYSTSAGFTGGGATTPPTATDAQNLLGTSTTGGQMFNTEGNIRWHVMADNASPYTFYAVAYIIGGSNVSTFLMCDRMLAGSFQAADADPYVWMTSGYNSFGNRNVLPTNTGTPANANMVSDTAFVRPDYGTTQGTPFAWYRYTLSGAAFVATPALWYTAFSGGNSYSAAPFGFGTNPWSSNDDLFPVLYGRMSNAAVPIGYKGTSFLLQWCGTQRTTGDTLTVSTTADRLVLNGALVVPWNGSTPLI